MKLIKRRLAEWVIIKKHTLGFKLLNLYSSESQPAISQDLFLRPT